MRPGIVVRFSLQCPGGLTLVSFLITGLNPFVPRRTLFIRRVTSVPSLPGRSRIPRSDRAIDFPLNVPFGVGGAVPFGDPSDSPSAAPIGGHLALFYPQWQASISDLWVLNTIKSGLSLEFRSFPPSVFLSCPQSRDRAKRILVSQAVAHLLAINAVQWVP